jgi:hypothetical protein
MGGIIPANRRAYLADLIISIPANRRAYLADLVISIPANRRAYLADLVISILANRRAYLADLVGSYQPIGTLCLVLSTSYHPGGTGLMSADI